jgi:hypothetical protein
MLFRDMSERTHFTRQAMPTTTPTTATNTKHSPFRAVVDILNEVCRSGKNWVRTVRWVASWVCNGFRRKMQRSQGKMASATVVFEVRRGVASLAPWGFVCSQHCLVFLCLLRVAAWPCPFHDTSVSLCGDCFGVLQQPHYLPYTSPCGRPWTCPFGASCPTAS